MTRELNLVVVHLRPADRYLSQTDSSLRPISLVELGMSFLDFVVNQYHTTVQYCRPGLETVPVDRYYFVLY